MVWKNGHSSANGDDSDLDWDTEDELEVDDHVVYGATLHLLRPG
ncbi:DNA (cytosine-5)-methyltransferase DRM2-like protein [Corchorus olitorius]|uniref:DNA (Cytosine-5)-methyltransferase DRM2-like protein n=1 Tax=Corchorus olitorius TaxID=93759 RepID=A0A1R3IDL0_9ROSI|nr:DNA (cytosine-5)-methyltransferase DRM2-like protein [Corchorus olitorius]